MLTAADYEEVLHDHRRLVRELDAILSYPDEPARQASLCDLLPLAKKIAADARRYRMAYKLRMIDLWDEETVDAALALAPASNSAKA